MNLELMNYENIHSLFFSKLFSMWFSWYFRGIMGPKPFPTLEELSLTRQIAWTLGLSKENTIILV